MFRLQGIKILGLAGIVLSILLGGSKLVFEIRSPLYTRATKGCSTGR